MSAPSPLRSALIRSLAVVALAAALFSPGRAAPQDPPRKRPIDRMLEISEATYKRLENSREVGRAEPADLYRWSRRWMEAARDSAKTPAARKAALQAHADRVRSLLANADRLYSAGRLPSSGLDEFRYYMAEAEHWLEMADAEPADRNR